MRLHHLALTCRDVPGVADFYARLLGVEELKRHHDEEGSLRSIWLQLDLVPAEVHSPARSSR